MAEMTTSTEMTTITLTPRETNGPELVGRAPGARLREEAVALAADHHVVIDLAGVEAMSPSFADEIFAKLPAALIRDRRIRFANASADIRERAAKADVEVIGGTPQEAEKLLRAAGEKWAPVVRRIGLKLE